MKPYLIPLLSFIPLLSLVPQKSHNHFTHVLLLVNPKLPTAQKKPRTLHPGQIYANYQFTKPTAVLVIDLPL
jgi:hypothetical protein